MKITVEIVVQTAVYAAAAERGGADRLELCEALEHGGVTPAKELMRAVREAVRIPVFAMIRPRAGNFVYDASEYSAMQREIEMAKSERMDGVVFGILNSQSHVDVEWTRRLVELAAPLPVTFHRAFDLVAELRGGLEDVIATGAKRVLTSAGASSASEGAKKLRELVELAGKRITILPGGGVTPENAAEVLQATDAGEIHSGLGGRIPYGADAAAQFELLVRELAGKCEEFTQGRS